MGCIADYDEDCKGKKPKGCMCYNCCKMIDEELDYDKQLALNKASMELCKLEKKRITRLKHKKGREYIHQKYPKLLIYCDILIAVSILFNFFALAITNYMVVHNQPEKKVYEVNPIVAQKNDYQAHPQSKSLFTALIGQLYGWFILILAYVYMRWKVSSETSKNIFVSIVLTWFVFLTYDFINDLGYLLGKIL